jgi:2,3-bisphosphoglycerate-dependent phosphoglycerate mutase
MKQNRGSSGEGIWIIKLKAGNYCKSFGERSCTDDEVLDLMEANDNHAETHTVAEFIEFCVNGRTSKSGTWTSKGVGKYLEGGKEAGGMLVDQRFCPRIVEGELRYNMVADKLVGIIHKKPKEGGISAVGGTGSIYTFYGPEEKKFANLTRNFLTKDLGFVMPSLGLADEPIPLWWTTDFILASPVGTPVEEEKWIVGEFNCSCVGVSKCLPAYCKDDTPNACYNDIPLDELAEANAMGTLMGEKALSIMRQTKPSANGGGQTFKVVFLRHGESDWNVKNIFTGWADVDLSEAGKLEALEAGKMLKGAGFKFDIVFTSVLRRAIRTAWSALMESDNFSMPIINTWRLNERHYGGLQGLNKAETAAKHGDEQVKIWRRSYDIPPPTIDQSDPRHPCNDPLYRHVPAAALPGAESLAMTVERVLPFLNDTILPCVMAGKSVMVAAHGNSLRAICKYLEGMSEDEVLELNIPTGVPLVYELSSELKVLNKYYLMDPEEVAKKVAAVANQGKAK